MTTDRFRNLPDTTPIIVGAAQYSEPIKPDSTPPLSHPMDLAAWAAEKALQDAANSSSELIDTIAIVRLFSDSAPAWKCPFGGSDNPPESVARRIGANPDHRIYSNSGGTQPMELLAELLAGIARGEKQFCLLAGTEAIGSQRYAQRNGLEPDWSETLDTPMDEREYTQRFAAPEELASGMFLPVHYYALIENRRAQEFGHDHATHRLHMGSLMAPFSVVAAANPHAAYGVAYTREQLASHEGGNYPISLPYSKLLIAQDAVNQAAALVLSSVGKARELGIPEDQWIFLQGYAQGMDQPPSQRVDAGRSEAMSRVIQHTVERAAAREEDLDLIDIYSCFPCAVEAACESIDLPIDGSCELTVTGGLPYFGGPGNNYTMHALVEMAHRLRGNNKRALVTANGGILSKHAAAVMANTPNAEGVAALDWAGGELEVIEPDSIDAVDFCEQPERGRIISYTVIHNRNDADVAVVLAETDSGTRFLARNNSDEVTTSITNTSPIGREITASPLEMGHAFEFAS